MDDRRRIGRYELLGRLAVGGMAELYLARRTGIEGFQKTVVLKRILPHLANNAEFVEMFLHEARLAATLEHPNVVSVYDIGKDGDDYFFTMAYLHGKDLLAILREAGRRQQPIPLHHAITIAIGICAGLHHAHERVGYDGIPLGIVHRDVSPANVIVTYDGAVKVVDFGIAKAAAQTNVTKVGVRKGKASYMSPEQCRGDDIDRRSDIWAIGVVLYEASTMTRLFRADNDLAIMHKIVDDPIRPPSAVVDDYPPDLEETVLRCLRRAPDQRYQTALELQHALERFAHEAHLVTSNAALGAYLLELFGPQPLPWTNTPLPGRSPRLASSAVLEDGKGRRPSGAADPGPRQPHPWGRAEPTDAAHGEGVTRTDLVSSARLSLSRRIGFGFAGAATVGVAMAATIALRPEDPPSPPPAAAASLVPAAVGDPEVPDPTPKQLAVLVNEADPRRALDFERRHAVAQRVRDRDPAAVDTRIQLALDLVQAADAAQPCVVLEQTLEAIEGDPQGHWSPWLQRARVPDGCNALEPRLSTLRHDAEKTEDAPEGPDEGTARPATEAVPSPPPPPGDDAQSR